MVLSVYYDFCYGKRRRQSIFPVAGSLQEGWRRTESRSLSTTVQMAVPRVKDQGASMPNVIVPARILKGGGLVGREGGAGTVRPRREPSGVKPLLVRHFFHCRIE